MPFFDRPLPRPLKVAAAAALTATVLTACGSTSDHASMPGMGKSASSGASAAPQAMTDVMFAQMMIPHHEQAVEMAELALEESSGASTEVRTLAQQISAAQGPEIEQMRGWLESWNASTGMPMGHDMTGMMSGADMSALKAASGPEFDRRWLTMMIEHHEGAITMAEQVLGTTTNSEVRTLAQAIVQGQQREITTMKGLLS